MVKSCQCQKQMLKWQLWESRSELFLKLDTEPRERGEREQAAGRGPQAARPVHAQKQEHNCTQTLLENHGISISLDTVRTWKKWESPLEHCSIPAGRLCR